VALGQYDWKDHMRRLAPEYRRLERSLRHDRAHAAATAIDSFIPCLPLDTQNGVWRCA
jgi:hypothetical protein